MSWLLDNGFSIESYESRPWQKTNPFSAREVRRKFSAKFKKKLQNLGMAMKSTFPQKL